MIKHRSYSKGFTDYIGFMTIHTPRMALDCPRSALNEVTNEGHSSKYNVNYLIYNPVRIITLTIFTKRSEARWEACSQVLSLNHRAIRCTFSRDMLPPA